MNSISRYAVSFEVFDSQATGFKGSGNKPECSAIVPRLTGPYLKVASTMLFKPVTRGAMDGMPDRLPSTASMMRLSFTFRPI